MDDKKVFTPYKLSSQVLTCGAKAREKAGNGIKHPPTAEMWLERCSLGGSEKAKSFTNTTIESEKKTNIFNCYIALYFMGKPPLYLLKEMGTKSKKLKKSIFSTKSIFIAHLSLLLHVLVFHYYSWFVQEKFFYLCPHPFYQLHLQSFSIDAQLVLQ